ncbi:hypothetical protein DY000_02030298 [Brassica cretica]|uniref:NAC domain-containing protein n=1 Tax=Brassica cretica TaxID=69181 RepID=A0ABQ7DFY9_BRACR|nr:hypothetical protein DY000_02030298 [Brassica cretica]
MADKKYLDPNPPLAIAQNSESEPEFKKQNLKELQTDECNIAHKAHTSAKIDDKDKTDPKLVEPFIKAFNTIKKFYPAGCRFRPSDDMMANYYLKNKVLGQPIKALIIPEECDHIFSIPPRYPIETEWHCYCRRPNGPESRNLWTREEESDVISLPGGIEPPREEWFIEEISQPPSIADTDLVFCHVILNKIEKEEAYIATSIIFGVMVVDVKPERPRFAMVQ